MSKDEDEWKSVNAGICDIKLRWDWSCFPSERTHVELKRADRKLELTAPHQLMTISATNCKHVHQALWTPERTQCPSRPSSQPSKKSMAIFSFPDRPKGHFRPRGLKWMTCVKVPALQRSILPQLLSKTACQLSRPLHQHKKAQTQHHMTFCEQARKSVWRNTKKKFNQESY